MRRLNIGEHDVLHVVPLNDMREHEAKTTCWCNPTQDDEEPRIWVHHALDGREDFEEGRRLPS